MGCWILLLVLSLPAPAQDVSLRSIYLAPGGDDAGPGSAARPFASPARAQRAAREVLARGEVAEVVVHDGFYSLAAPLLFGPEDSGTSERPLVWRAAKGAAPVFSGGRAIGGWTRAEDGTLRTHIEEVARGDWTFRELFVGGERRPRARHPNAGWFRVERAGPDSRTSFTFRGGDLMDLPDASAAELHFLHDWSTSRIPVASIDLASRTLTTRAPVGPAAAHYAIDNFEAHARYRIENHPALLDASGEWYLDEAGGELILLPLIGETAETIEAVAPWLETLVVVRGGEQRPVRHLEFHGLAFEHCAWRLPERGYSAGQACFHEPRRPGYSGDEIREFVPAAVHFEGAEDCRLVACRLEHLGGSGVWIGSRCHRCEVAETEVVDVSGNGVMIGEDTSREVDGTPWWQAAPEQAGTGNVVVDCTVERVGVQFHGAVGIWTGIVRESRIEHNTVRFTPYTGVSLGWRWSTEETPTRDNRVAYNHIHHVMQILSDGGGIYTLGRQPGSTLVGNHIHDVPLNAGRAESNGMFLDEGTTGFVVEGNLFHHLERSPLRFHRATTNLVRANVFVLAGETPPVRYNATDPANVTLEHNQSVDAAAFDPANFAGLIEAAGSRVGQ